jgi:hypothetical protein
MAVSFLLTGSVQGIIRELALADPLTGRAWAVEKLAGMMRPKVETASRGGAQATLPLLTMTVRGGDPELLKHIAEKWAEVFVEKNSQLFASEAARSYDFILVQYRETQAALQKLGEEGQRFLDENPIPLLKDEQETKRDDLKLYQDTLLNLSAELALKRQEYEESAAHLNELTADGRWLGFSQPSDSNPRAPAGTPEQVAVLKAKQQFFDAQQRLKDFQQSAELALLKQRRSHLLDDFLGVGQVTERGLLGNYTSQLEETENKVKAQSRTLEILEAEIKKVPQFLFGLKTEEFNPSYTALADRIISTRTSLETDRERVNLLRRRVEEARSEVRRLEKELAEKEGVQLPRLQNELALARALYEKEQTRYGDLQTQAVDLRSAIGKIQAQRSEYEKLISAYRTDLGPLSRRVAAAESQILEFDRENTALGITFTALAALLQDARVAKGEQASSIRVVEAAVTPQVPVAISRQLNVLLISPVLGLFLGVVVVFLVHYLQVPSSPRQERHPPQPGPPAT